MPALLSFCGQSMVAVVCVTGRNGIAMDATIPTTAASTAHRRVRCSSARPPDGARSVVTGRGEPDASLVSVTRSDAIGDGPGREKHAIPHTGAAAPVCGIDAFGPVTENVYVRSPSPRLR
ncbi:hypothetical protein RDE2_32210 [Rhodococcus sp. RDE2]|nr:hypothetical protein RDE2_32210 [Rhodococcus sp. RDE2]